MLAKADFAFISVTQAKQQPANFFLTGTAQTGQRQHFPRLQIEADRADITDHHVIELQHGRPIFRQRFTLIVSHCFADDHLHQIAQ
ncbi:hypothetical protein D3C75_1243650 [compost metagenome]